MSYFFLPKHTTHKIIIKIQSDSNVDKINTSYHYYYTKMKNEINQMLSNNLLLNQSYEMIVKYMNPYETLNNIITDPAYSKIKTFKTTAHFDFIEIHHLLELFAGNNNVQKILTISPYFKEINN